MQPFNFFISFNRKLSIKLSCLVFEKLLHKLWQTLVLYANLSIFGGASWHKMTIRHPSPTPTNHKFGNYWLSIDAQLIFHHKMFALRCIFNCILPAEFWLLKFSSTYLAVQILPLNFYHSMLTVLLHTLTRPGLVLCYVNLDV